ncbi:MAG: DUF6941 family protein [Solidesulfovibrio sp. DCME]|uniref:DUF6941 family protein n=1 Tax=Solidesulfovibrio sp. DCME TaxID=3447380 RepID=UPI003D0AC89A
MIKHCWSILCQNIITDAETNVVSYIITIDNIMAPEFPAKIPFLAIGTSWEKDTGYDVVENFAIRIIAINPRGKAKTLVETGDLAVQSHRHRMNFVLNGFAFDEPGISRFTIEAKINGLWLAAASLPVLVAASQIQTAGTPSMMRQ